MPSRKIVRNTRTKLAIVAGLAVAALWAIPLFRAVIFLGEARDAYRGGSSFTAGPDYDYARRLLLFYVSGAVTTELLVWMFIKTCNPVLFIHLSSALSVHCLIVGMNPDGADSPLILKIVSPSVLAAGYWLLLVAGVPFWIFSRLDRPVVVE